MNELKWGEIGLITNEPKTKFTLADDVLKYLRSKDYKTVSVSATAYGGAWNNEWKY